MNIKLQLLVLFIVCEFDKSSTLSCRPCHSFECVTPTCKGGLVLDACGCCNRCARMEGESCGGPWVGNNCDTGLKCNTTGLDDQFAGYCVPVKSTYVYLSNQTTVMRFNTETLPKNQQEVLYNGTGYIRAIAIDDLNNHLYWADMRYNTIYQSSLNGENKQTLFNYAIGFVQSLSVDWSSNNIYWTDSLMKMIEVSTTTGQHRKVLFQLDKTDQPRGLICNSEAGYLFWTDWGSNPRIERSTLSGSDRKTIISKNNHVNLKWPNDLDIDYQSSRLYWIDASTDTIESSNFDGENRKMEVKLQYFDTVIHPYSFAYNLAQNVTYITDWFSDSLYTMNGGFNNNSTRLFYNNSVTQKQIGQVRISGDKRVTAAYKPCLTSDDNKCTHLCYKVSRMAHACGCPTGMVADGTNGCKEAVRDFEIYFADSLATSVNHVIKYKDQPGFTIRPLPLPTNEKLQYPVALDYNPDEQKIYWTDAKTKKLYRMKENGDNFEVVSSSISSYALAIDELSNVLYYFDNATKAIIMSSLDGTYTKIIKSDKLENIYDIAIHEEKGYIFYTDYGNSVIARIDIDGKQFLTTRNYVNPVTGNTVVNTVRATGLTVDKNENRVYWCDGSTYQIRSTDLDFQNPRTIVQETYYFRQSFWLLQNTGNVIRPFSLAILNDKLYWTDTYKRAIYGTNKRFGGNIEFVTGGINHPRDIHVFNDAPRIETDKIYMFSFAKATKYHARCVRNNTCQPIKKIDAPANCPTGYTETNYTSRCSACSEALGANFVCPCTDWATCAQRTYGKIYGCHPEFAFMNFKVRECTKTIKPGKCSYDAQNRCPIIPEKDCKADQDCDGENKCCKTKCGMKCSSPVTTSDHPCKVNNGGCSHFCMAKQYEYKCMCPDGMFLSADKTKCLRPSCETKICKNGGKCIPLANGGSYCRCSKDYWIGSSCAIDLRNQLITAKFVKKTKKAIVFSKFSEELAMGYSDFCKTYPCVYNMEPIVMTRGRRAVASKFHFTSEDIYHTGFKQSDSPISFTFVLTQHRDEYNVRNGNLDKDSMLAGLKKFGDALATKYGMTIQETSVSPQVTDEDKGMSYVIIIIIVVIIIVAIALFAALFYFVRIKRKKKLPPPSGPAPSGNSGNVRWQFENQLYDDLNQPPITLDGQSVTNQQAWSREGSRAGSRAGSRRGEGERAAAVIPVNPVDIKKVPKEWVRFEKGDEKPPITDFVSAELYSDPYNLEDPPEYTSRAATPVGSVRLPQNNSYKI